jgi:hypothetical protein
MGAMTNNLKKALILLKALIFHYHGLDDDEKKIMEGYVGELEAEEEYEWAIQFISSDYLSAFDRAREFLSKAFLSIDKDQRVRYLLENWEDNHQKGYVTEMETTAMINLAKDWQIEKEFLMQINQF